MTLPVTDRIAGPYSCNGTVDDFDFAFKVFTTADIRVVKTAADGTETVLVLDSGYTVVLNVDQENDPGGTVTTSSAFATGFTVTIDGNLSYGQTAELTNLGPFFPKVIERALDRLAILIQQLKKLMDRSIKLSVSDTIGSTELPSAAQRANRVLGFDAAGDITTHSVATTVYGQIVERFTATAAQTAFALANAYVPGVNAVAVFQNGLRLRGDGIDYTETSGMVVTLTNGAVLNDEIDVVIGQEAASSASLASAVAYTPAGSGALTIDVQAALRRDVNVKDFGVVGDGVTDDTAAWRLAVTAATGKTLHVEGGINSKITGIIDLPRSIKIIGGSRRGLDSPPIGTRLFAAFAGPIFRYAPGSVTSADITLDGLTIIGDKATYGAGNGVTLTNAVDCTLQNCVVANFGTHNVAISGGNHVSIKDVYASSAGDSNFYVDGEYCGFYRASSDAGLYGVRNTTNGYGLSLTDCHFEGATVNNVHMAGQRTRLVDSFVNATTAATKGVYIDAVRCEVVGCELLGPGSGTSIGIECAAGRIEYRIVGNMVSAFTTAMKAIDGFGTISANVFEGSTTGVEMTGGSFFAVVSGNVIGGATNSLLHNSGNNVLYVGNRYDDGAGVFKAPTVTSGSPQFIDAPTITEKAGTGVGDYSTASATYADVDETNLAYTVTIPKCWKLGVTANCVSQLSQSGVMTFGILDGSIIAEGPFDIVAETDQVRLPYFLQTVIAGDGAAHTIKLQWKASAGIATMNNSSAAQAPRMVFTLSPSNP